MAKRIGHSASQTQPGKKIRNILSRNVEMSVQNQTDGESYEVERCSGQVVHGVRPWPDVVIDDCSQGVVVRCKVDLVALYGTVHGASRLPLGTDTPRVCVARSQIAHESLVNTFFEYFEYLLNNM